MEPKDYVIISLIVLLIGLVIILLIDNKKKNKNNSINELKDEIKKANDEQEKRILDDNNRLKNDISQIQHNTSKDFIDFKEKLNQSIDDKFKEINNLLFDKILKEMNENVSQNFEKTSETFKELQNTIAQIDAAQKNLQNVETSIESFKSILDDKKMRGNFGELQLNTILIDMFGEREEVYSIQHKLSNNNMADVLLKLPNPLGNIVVDSKFPLENYKKMYAEGIGDSERESYRKKFKEDIKKHIRDISTKYIIPNETANQAMMFVPSESVFAEIYGNHQDLVEFSNKYNVWITSPTTLMAIVETIVVVLKDKERNKNAGKILEELKKLAVDFNKYTERWDKFEKRLGQVVEDANKINISSKKITSKFNRINNASIDTIEEINEFEQIEDIENVEEVLW